MKKYFLQICSVLFVFVLFSSCSNDKNYIVGKWEFQSAVRERTSNANTTDVQVDTIYANNVSLNIVQFKKKGTVSFTGIDVVENNVSYSETYDWSVSEDGKMLYLTNGTSTNGSLGDREIEILTLTAKQLQTRTIEIGTDYTFVYTSNYKRK